jgi:hypothetical protein
MANRTRDANHPFLTPFPRCTLHFTRITSIPRPERQTNPSEEGIGLCKETGWRARVC